MAVKAERYIPNDPKLLELFSKCSVNISVKTEPPAAQIYAKDYRTPESEWEFLGISPIENIRVPMGFLRWKINKKGYETVYAASQTWRTDRTKKRDEYIIPNDLVRVLDKKESLPPGMVRVPDTETAIGKFGDFFIDKFEVTNKQFKEFIDGGGYRDQKYWKHDFIKDGNTLTWEEATAEFVDRTGRNGPALWEAGDYPEGQDDYPVTGISWYEASAYAEFVGKSLPTATHWDIARGNYTPLIRSRMLAAVLIPNSNFKDRGPVPVGNLQGITSYGAYDMAGNVREWCWNETPQGRLVRGGAWNDATYMFGNLSQAVPFDRSPKNGFRCALYIDPDKIPEAAFEPIIFREEHNFYAQKPVPDSIFLVYKEQFSYDKTDLNAQIEKREEGSEDWIREKITFDAAYGHERIIAYLFLPKNITPPFQTVIYFPGSTAVFQKSSEDIEGYKGFIRYFPFILKKVGLPFFQFTKGRSNEVMML